MHVAVPGLAPKKTKNGIPRTIKKVIDSRLKLKGSVSAGITGKIDVKSTQKWSFQSPDLGVRMVRIIHCEREP
jgi:hypothetical protein